MKPTMAARIRALREPYREAFGEETRSRHGKLPWKHVAGRLRSGE